jgi:hypothetical protein
MEVMGWAKYAALMRIGVDGEMICGWEGWESNERQEYSHVLELAENLCRQSLSRRAVSGSENAGCSGAYWIRQLDSGLCTLYVAKLCGLRVVGADCGLHTTPRMLWSPEAFSILLLGRRSMIHVKAV